MNCGNMYLPSYFKKTLYYKNYTWTTSMCEFKAHFFIKSAPHLLHLFSSFWFKAINANMWTTSMCELQANFFVKSAPHLSHLNGFCPSWTTSRLLFDPKLPTKLTFKHFYNVKLGYWKSFVTILAWIWLFLIWLHLNGFFPSRTTSIYHI